MLRWIRSLFKKDKAQIVSPQLKKELEALEFEEEALRRIKRINDLRAEIDRLVSKAYQKGIKKAEAGTENTKSLNTSSPIFPLYGRQN